MEQKQPCTKYIGAKEQLVKQQHKVVQQPLGDRRHDIQPPQNESRMPKPRQPEPPVINKQHPRQSDVKTLQGNQPGQKQQPSSSRPTLKATCVPTITVTDVDATVSGDALHGQPQLRVLQPRRLEQRLRQTGVGMREVNMPWPEQQFVLPPIRFTACAPPQGPCRQQVSG